MSEFATEEEQDNPTLLSDNIVEEEDNIETPTRIEIEEVEEELKTDDVNKIILNEDPLVYTIDNYLTHEECDHFVSVSKEKLKRAFVSDTKTGTVSQGRTGYNYWLRHNNDSTTSDVGQRISKEVGIPLENAEAYQVVAYDETQKYDSHWDAYTKNDSEKCLRCLKYGGQRMVTALVYLSDVEEGGHTRFDKLNINVEPKKGRLLIFHNTIKGTNTVHPDSLHAGCPVIKGYKYAFNLWFREISMKKVYDFPFLKEKKKLEESVDVKVNEKTEGIKLKIEEGVETIDINSSGSDISTSVVSKEPFVSHVRNALTENECKYILSKCLNGKEQARGRTSFWVNLKDGDMVGITEKIGKMIGLDNTEYFENINVILYPVDCDHGCHFDAFDLKSERGQNFSKARGQRLYTVACLLDSNEDINTGSFKFRELNKEVKMNRGDICFYQNFSQGSQEEYQRDERLEYALNPVRKSAKHYFYLFVREKTRSGEAMLKSVVKKIDARVEEIKESHATMVQESMVTNEQLKDRMEQLMKNNVEQKIEPRVQDKKQEVEEKKNTEEPNTENYYTTLEHFYEHYKKTNQLVPYRKLGFRRHNSPKDVETIKELYDFRKGFMLNDVHSLLNPDVLNVEYVQDEYTPVVVNNVFTEQASKMIREYYHNSIDNDKFQFGDRQAERWKAYDDFMSRIMQFEALPLIEHIAKKRLKPTYTYLSCYKKGADLPAHTDRPECEFTISFMIDKPEGSYWPIYVDKEKQPIKFKGRYRNYVNADHIDNCIPVDCEANGLMMFCGTDHIHFREKLEHDYYYITLLHYMTY